MRVHSRGTAAAVVAAVTITGGITAAAAPASATDRGHARPINVIYLVGDGMGRTHVTAARQRFFGAAGKLAMERLPVVGQVSTYAVERGSAQPGRAGFAPNLVTDSASSATAWSSGVKTYNAALGVDAKGKVVPTLMEMAHRAGYRTGNVSTAEITDATPAGQMSHVLARGCQGPSYSAASCQDMEVTGTELATTDLRVTPVAKQIARNGTADVILGGGLARFDADDEKALRGQGYTVLCSPTKQSVATRADLKTATSGKVFGLFNRGNLTVEKFKRENPSAPQALEELKAFDEAVAAATAFARKDRHTLVIVTADHECAGFNIIERGSRTNAESVAPPSYVDGGNVANNWTPSRASSGSKDPARSSGIRNGAGAGDPRNFAPATFRTPDDPASVQDCSPEASLWLSYLSGNHTGADVPLFAYGPNGWRLATSIDNTDLFDVVGRTLRVVR